MTSVLTWLTDKDYTGWMPPEVLPADKVGTQGFRTMPSSNGKVGDLKKTRDAVIRDVIAWQVDCERQNRLSKLANITTIIENAKSVNGIDISQIAKGMDFADSPAIVVPPIVRPKRMETIASAAKAILQELKYNLENIKNTQLLAVEALLVETHRGTGQPYQYGTDKGEKALTQIYDQHLDLSKSFEIKLDSVRTPDAFPAVEPPALQRLREWEELQSAKVKPVKGPGGFPSEFAPNGRFLGTARAKHFTATAAQTTAHNSKGKKPQHVPAHKPQSNSLPSASNRHAHSTGGQLAPMQAKTPNAAVEADLLSLVKGHVTPDKWLSDMRHEAASSSNDDAIYALAWYNESQKKEDDQKKHEQKEHEQKEHEQKEHEQKEHDQKEHDQKEHDQMVTRAHAKGYNANSRTRWVQNFVVASTEIRQHYIQLANDYNLKQNMEGARDHLNYQHVNKIISRHAKAVARTHDLRLEAEILATCALRVQEDLQGLDMGLPVHLGCSIIAAAVLSVTTVFCAYFEILSLCSTQTVRDMDVDAFDLAERLTTFYKSAYAILKQFEDAGNLARYRKRREVMTGAAVFGAVSGGISTVLGLMTAGLVFGRR